MTKINIDTEKMVTASKEINGYVAKIDSLLLSYIERMNKVPSDTKEWQGNAAEEFVELIKKEYKSDFLPLLNCIKKYATELETVANEHNAIVVENSIC